MAEKRKLEEKGDWNSNITFTFADGGQRQLLKEFVLGHCASITALLSLPVDDKDGKKKEDTDREIRVPFSSSIFVPFRTLLYSGKIPKEAKLEDDSVFQTWCDVAALCGFCDFEAGIRAIAEGFKKLVEYPGEENEDLFKKWLTRIAELHSRKQKLLSLWDLLKVQAVTYHLRKLMSERSARNIDLKVVGCYDTLLEGEGCRLIFHHAATCCRDSLECNLFPDAKLPRDVVKHDFSTSMTAPLRSLTQAEEKLSRLEHYELTEALTKPLCWNFSVKEKQIAKSLPPDTVTRFCCAHHVTDDQTFRQQITMYNTKRRKVHALWSQLAPDLLSSLLLEAFFGTID